MTTEFKPPSADDPVVTEIVQKLVQVYRPERIYLFGSAARGEAGPDSDYDFLVIVGDHTSPEFRRSGRGYQAIWRLGPAADVVVYPRALFEDLLGLNSSLPATVVSEGKLLYGC